MREPLSVDSETDCGDWIENEPCYHNPDFKCGKKACVGLITWVAHAGEMTNPPKNDTGRERDDPVPDSEDKGRD